MGSGRRGRGLCVVVLVLCAHAIAASDKVQAAPRMSPLELAPWGFKVVQAALAHHPPPKPPAQLRSLAVQPRLVARALANAASQPQPPQPQAQQPQAQQPQAQQPQAQQLQAQQLQAQQLQAQQPQAQQPQAQQPQAQQPSQQPSPVSPPNTAGNESALRPALVQAASWVRSVVGGGDSDRNWCESGDPEPCTWINKLRVVTWYLAANLELMVDAQGSRQAIRETYGESPSFQEWIVDSKDTFGLPGVLMTFVVACVFAFTDLAGPASRNMANQLVGWVPGIVLAGVNALRVFQTFHLSHAPSPPIRSYLLIVGLGVLATAIAIVLATNYVPMLLIGGAVHLVLQVGFHSDLMRLLPPEPHDDVVVSTAPVWEPPPYEHRLHMARDADGWSILIHDPGYGDEEYPYPNDDEWVENVPDMPDEFYAPLHGSEYFSWVYYYHGVFYVKDESGDHNNTTNTNH